mgnify:CR=1 FL=1
MKLVEPSEETYALVVNENNFAIFDLFYTDLGYKTISGEPLNQFANHYGYFIVDKSDKTISFMETLVFSIYEDKEYGIMGLIKFDE